MNKHAGQNRFFCLKAVLCLALSLALFISQCDMAYACLLDRQMLAQRAWDDNVASADAYLRAQITQAVKIEFEDRRKHKADIPIADNNALTQIIYDIIVAVFSNMQQPDTAVKGVMSDATRLSGNYEANIHAIRNCLGTLISKYELRVRINRAIDDSIAIAANLPALADKLRKQGFTAEDVAMAHTCFALNSFTPKDARVKRVTDVASAHFKYVFRANFGYDRFLDLLERLKDILEQMLMSGPQATKAETALRSPDLP